MLQTLYLLFLHILKLEKINEIGFYCMLTGDALIQKSLTDLDDPDFSVEALSGEVFLSRTQVHRKLKALADKSPNQLIRDFRLARAKELLEQKSATVSEVAYQVGYSNLSYFSKSYKDAFGVSPSARSTN